MHDAAHTIEDFRYCDKCLVDQLLSQGYRALSLEKSLKKFYGSYQDLIDTRKYEAWHFCKAIAYEGPAQKAVLCISKNGPSTLVSTWLIIWHLLF